MQTGIRPLWIGIGILVLSAAGCSLFGPKLAPTLTPIPATPFPTPLQSVIPTSTPTPYTLHIVVTPQAAHAPVWREFRSYNAVYDMAFAPDGSLWTMSEADVAQWDTVANQAKPYRVPAGTGYLTSLDIDSHGLLWIGTHNGILKLDSGQWVTYTLDADDRANHIWSLEIGPDDAVWVVNNQGGLYRFDGKGWNRQREASLFKLAFAPNGDLWSISDSSVYRFDGKNWTGYPGDQVGITNFSTIAAAPDGSIWVGTAGPKGTGKGAAHFDGQKWTIYQKADGLADNNVSDIAISADGVVWIATFWGVSRFDGDQWVNYRMEDGLPQNYMETIAIAPDGQIWAGSVAGLYRFDGQNWAVLPIHALAGYPITAIKSQPNGTVWFSTIEAGLSCFDGANWTSYTADMGLSQEYSNHIKDFAISSEGTLWAISGLGNLSRLEGHTWKLLPQPVADGTWIKAITIGADGAIWLASEEGVTRLDGQGPTAFPVNAARPSYLWANFVDIRTAADGAIWTGSSSGAVFRFDGEIWELVVREPGLCRNRCIFPTADGAVWVGGQEELYWFKGDERIVYDFSTLPPISNSSRQPTFTIEAIFKGPDDSIWLVPQTWGDKLHSVFRFDGKILEEYTLDHAIDGYTAGPISNPAQAIWLALNDRLLALVNP